MRYLTVLFLTLTFFSFSYAFEAASPVMKKEDSFVAKKLKEEREMSRARAAIYDWRKQDGQLPDYEKLTFDVDWKFITVGQATLELRGYEDIDGRPAHHIYSSARTASFFDNFYPVRDVHEAWFDKESKVSLKFASDVSEGGFKKNEKIYFNQIENTFLLNDNGKMQMGEIPSHVQDILTSLYYIRTMPLEPGKEYRIDAHTGDLSWPLSVKVKKQETIETAFGKIDCLLLEPAIRQDSGLFKADGKIEVWVTNDNKKIPVLMTASVPIAGKVKAVLKEITDKQ